VAAWSRKKRGEKTKNLISGGEGEMPHDSKKKMKINLQPHFKKVAIAGRRRSCKE